MAYRFSESARAFDNIPMAMRKLKDVAATFSFYR
jgi:hypothetical protein